jgi:3-isopropylmalate/(R)-2-methylmalate dehydratase small subunit
LEIEESTMEKIDDKDELEIDTARNKITNLSKNNESYSMKPFPELIANIIKAGGLMNYKYDEEEGKTRGNN